MTWHTVSIQCKFHYHFCNWHPIDTTHICMSLWIQCVFQKQTFWFSAGSMNGPPPQTPRPCHPPPSILQPPSSLTVALIPLCSLPGPPTKPRAIFRAGPLNTHLFLSHGRSQALAPWCPKCSLSSQELPAPSLHRSSVQGLPAKLKAHSTCILQSRLGAALGFFFF